MLINHANGYVEEKGMNRYLIFDSTDENKELLKKYNDVWNGVKVVASVITKKITWKLNLILMMTYH